MLVQYSTVQLLGFKGGEGLLGFLQYSTVHTLQYSTVQYTHYSTVQYSILSSSGGGCEEPWTLHTQPPPEEDSILYCTVV